MKPGPSRSAYSGAVHTWPVPTPYGELYAKFKAGGVRTDIGRHELALRIRAHFGYAFLMAYKRHRRLAAAARRDTLGG